MTKPDLNQWPTSLQSPLSAWMDAFIRDRQSQNMAAGTIRFYRIRLDAFLDFCQRSLLSSPDQLTADHIRAYILEKKSSHNPGGLHQYYRALKTFLLWIQVELDLVEWHNPIRHIKPPKLAVEPLDPVDPEHVRAMLDTCRPASLVANRDKAILLCLLDTGARAAEFIHINLADYDQSTGSILIRCGKGRKPRTVYLGERSRRAVRAYLRSRDDNCPALWVTDDGYPLSYFGLNEIVRRRALKAGIPKPELHAFRRAFALSMLRAGTDVFTLQKLMGHADLQVLRRYLAQTDQDTRAAHHRASPVDDL